MISVNLPENSQDSSQSALELLRPDPPLEQKAEAKIQGNLLNGIDNCLVGALKGIYDAIGQQVLVEIFDCFNLQRKPVSKYWPFMVSVQKIDFGKNCILTIQHNLNQNI